MANAAKSCAGLHMGFQYVLYCSAQAKIGKTYDSSSHLGFVLVLAGHLVDEFGLAYREQCGWPLCAIVLIALDINCFDHVVTGVQIL